MQDRDERPETSSVDPSEEGDLSDFGEPAADGAPVSAAAETAEPTELAPEPASPSRPVLPPRPAHGRARIEGVEAGVAAGLVPPARSEPPAPSDASDEPGHIAAPEDPMQADLTNDAGHERPAAAADASGGAGFEGYQPFPASSPALQDWRDPPTREVPRVLLDHPLADPAPAYPGPVWREVESDWDHDDLTFAEIVSEGTSVAEHGLGADEPDPFAFDFEVGPGFVGHRSPAAETAWGESDWGESDWDIPFDGEHASISAGDSDDVIDPEPPISGRQAPPTADARGTSAREPGKAMHLARVTFVGRGEAAPSPSEPAGRAAGWARAAKRRAKVPRPAAPVPAHAPAQPPREAARRNPVVATATGLAIGLFVLLCFSAGPPVVLGLVTVVLLISTAECYQVLRRARYQPAVLLGLLAVVAVCLAGYLKGPQAFPIVGAAFVFATMCWYLFGFARRSPVANIGATVTAWLWVGMLGGFGVLLLDPTAFPHRHGLAYLLGAIAATQGYDVGGYAFGSWIGKHPLARRISPNKTWEGLLGGCFVAIVISVGVMSHIAPWTVPHALELGIVVSVFAPLGDLVESMIKRDLKVKDMGTLLPAHGGLLDRVDGLLFVLPATYVLVRLFHG